ncbi:hypothetical protein GCM10009805_07670 [Leucobacter chromiireducens subsp. solipictus]
MVALKNGEHDGLSEALREVRNVWIRRDGELTGDVCGKSDEHWPQLKPVCRIPNYEASAVQGVKDTPRCVLTEPEVRRNLRGSTWATSLKEEECQERGIG